MFFLLCAILSIKPMFGVNSAGLKEIQVFKIQIVLVNAIKIRFLNAKFSITLAYWQEVKILSLI